MQQQENSSSTATFLKWSSNSTSFFIVRKLTSYQLRDLFLVGSGIGLFIFILLRAMYVSLSADEQGTYYLFVATGTIFPVDYDLFSANNHALNTALMWVTSNLFGPGQLSLRLPNVLAGGLYIFSIAMMSRRMRYPLVGALAFVFATTNPFLVEYFGLARGYGIANGLMAFAFWQMWIYCDEGYRWKNLVAVLVAGVLAVFANYTYLNLFLPLAGTAFLVSLWQPAAKDPGRKVRFLQAGSSLLTVIGLLAVVIPISLKISAVGGFWSNNFRHFWSDSVASLVECSLMNASPGNGLIQWIVLSIQVIAIIVFVRILWWTKQQWSKKEFALFPLVIAIVLSLSVLSAVAQYAWLDTPLPIQRICLYFLWPWLLLVGIAASLPSDFHRWIATFFFLVTGVQAAHFFYTASLEDQAMRAPSVQVIDAIHYMQDHAERGERIALGYDEALWSFGFEYYRLTLPMREFDITRDSLMTHPLNEYCLVSPSCTERMAGNWIPEQTYLNGNVLYRNVNYAATPGVLYELDLIRDTAHGSEGFPDVFNFGGYIHDSIYAPLGMKLCLNYAIATSEKLSGHFNVLIFRQDQLIFSKQVGIYPGDEELISGENHIIIPQLRTGDNVIASLNTTEGKVKAITNFKMTIEGY